MIRTGVTGQLAFSVINGDGMPVPSYSWTDIGGGVTEDFEVRLVDGTPAVIEIARITEIGDGDYLYELTAAENAARGKIAYRTAISGYDNTRRWEDAVDVSPPAALLSGTAQTGGALTIRLASGAVEFNDQYKNGIIVLTGGTGEGQINTIVGTDSSTDDASVSDAWAVTPDATTTYEILPGPSPRAVATDVWEGLVLESGLTAGDEMRGIFSATLCKHLGLDAIRAAGGTGTVTLYAADGSTIRATVAVTTNGRTTFTPVDMSG